VSFAILLVSFDGLLVNSAVLLVNSTVSGKKIGLTSKAMQEVLGMDEPDYGHLLDTMKIENDGCISQFAVNPAKSGGRSSFHIMERFTWSQYYG
jgi:hypothetical protein